MALRCAGQGSCHPSPDGAVQRALVYGSDYGILHAVLTTVLGAVLIALPMTTSRVVISLCGLLVLIVGVAILVDRLKNRRPKEPSESDIIDAL